MARKVIKRKKSTKKVITAKQKSARRKNIAVARAKKKKGSTKGNKSKAWFTKGGNKMAPVEKAVSNLPRKTMKVKPVKLTAAEQAYMNRVLGG